jgi:dipeptidyl aminopeptidase/acylaminoacyl peptidase
MRDIERYLNIRSAYGMSLSPANTLAFLMDTTGVPQVWTLDSPGEWPEQRTFYDERVTFCAWSPEREELAFGMDAGGNERQQLHLLDLTETDSQRENDSTGNTTNLTAIPDAKHRWGGWSHDGERFAFASNRRDNAVFDIYTQHRKETGDEATLVHEGDGWLTVGGWSPDDDRLLVTEAYSNFDQDVYVLDLASDDLTHLTPHEGNVRYQSATWGPEGDLYLVTDEESDTLVLARLDMDGSLDRIEKGGDWNINGVAVDDETSRIVYSRNVDGYTELTTGRLDGGTDVTHQTVVDLPGAIAGGVSFSDDSDRFAITATGRLENTNGYVIDTATNQATQWTRASTAGIQQSSFVAPELIRYKTFDDREIPAFFSLPHDAETETGSTPVIVDIHGGPESQRRPSFDAVTQYLLAHGYAVFEPNVRGSSGYGTAYTHLDDVEQRMDSVADIRSGVEWLHDHSAVDSDRVVAYGGSYGGFMVLASMTEYPDLWAAGVDIVGIANFVTFLENTGDWRRELREAEYGSLESDRDFLESISPINNVEDIRAPLFVLHGANDPRVPVGEAEQIAEQAAQGVPVEKLIFEDEGHGLTKRENRIEAYSQIIEFLDEHV